MEWDTGRVLFKGKDTELCSTECLGPSAGIEGGTDSPQMYNYSIQNNVSSSYGEKPCH